MADKTIGDLDVVPGSINDSNTLFVVQQSGAAYKVSGADFISALSVIREAHGGIASIEKTSSSGTNPVVDTYTITYSDNTTTTFTVTNGAKGNTGNSCYVHIKYSAVQPTADSDMTNDPSAWMGIYSGTSSSAPTHYTSYSWNNVKGSTGSAGSPATLQTSEVRYQTSSSGTVVPTGTWSASVPTVGEAEYLWTRTTLTFNTGNPVVFYAVAYQGSNGSGSGTVTAVNTVQPSAGGNVSLTATDIPTSDSSDVQTKLTGLASDVSGLSTTVSGKAAQADVVLKDGTTIVAWGSSSYNVNNLVTGIVLCNASVLNTPSADWWMIVSAGDATSRTQTAYALFNSVPPKVRNMASGSWSPWDDINYVKPQTATVTLSGTWSGSGPYTQTVTISGATITSYTKVDVQPDATLLSNMVSAGCSALFIQNNSGTLTAYAIGAAPNSSSTNVQVTYYETA